MGGKQGFCRGNAATDGAARRGWLIGHFVPEGDLRSSPEVEVKWGTHRAAEERQAPQQAEHRTTVVLLVSGRFEVALDGERLLLEEPGDYLMWGPGTGHSWRALDDSVVLTVRWPSVP